MLLRSLTDSDGKTKSFGETLSDLRISFADLDEVQKTQYASAIAGKEGMSGLLALINSSDEDFDKLTDSIKNCTGASEKMAEIRLDNLEGDVTLFKSALEGAQIAISDKLTPVLRNLVKKATDWLPTVQDKLLSAIDVVMDIGKYLAQELTPILSSIGKSVLPIIKDVLKSAKAIIEQLVPVIKNIWKFAEPVFKVAVDALDLIVGYLPTLLQDDGMVTKEDLMLLNRYVSSDGTLSIQEYADRNFGFERETDFQIDFGRKVVRAKFSVSDNVKRWDLYIDGVLYGKYTNLTSPGSAIPVVISAVHDIKISTETSGTVSIAIPQAKL